MSPTQCRMARAALRWTLDDLQRICGVSRPTAIKLEKGGSVAPRKREAVRAAFIAEGIEFINGRNRVGVSYLRED